LTRPTPLKPRVLVRAYEMARNGLNDFQIRKLLHRNWIGWKYWLEKHPDLVWALEEGRKVWNQEKKSFREYVHGRLSPEARTLWNRINDLDEDADAQEKIERMFTRTGGKRMRQQLFLYAFVDRNFNASEACRLVNITHQTLMDWLRYDKEFKMLYEEMHWHKGNFFEECLVSLCKGGDTTATIFANKTFNRKRGYSDKITVEHTGEIKHTTEHKLADLPLELRKQILHSIREKKAAVPQIEDKSTIIDAEYEVRPPDKVKEKKP
jgi:hypothetical protein